MKEPLAAGQVGVRRALGLFLPTSRRLDRQRPRGFCAVVRVQGVLVDARRGNQTQPRCVLRPHLFLADERLAVENPTTLPFLLGCWGLWLLWVWSWLGGTDDPTRVCCYSARARTVPRCCSFSSLAAIALPLVPLLLIFAGYALIWLVQQGQARPGGVPLSIGLAVVVLLGIAANAGLRPAAPLGRRGNTLRFGARPSPTGAVRGCGALL